MKHIAHPTLGELLAIGCRVGQEVHFQIVTTKERGKRGKKTVINVYDADTKRLIGVIKR
jgi:hypothetical protein